MLEAIGPGGCIIDGNEGSYYYDDRESYFHAYHTMKQRALSLVEPTHRPTYRAKVLAGMALYMDQVLGLREPGSSYISYYLTPEERCRWFEHNVYWALKTTDEYVWCYSERMSWWEDRVPEGAEQAIRSAREKVEQGKSLGFEIASLVSRGKQNMDAVFESRLVQRSTTIRSLSPGKKPPRLDGDLSDAVRIPDQELSTWSSVVQWFPEPEHFGVWRFER